jgi:hypothetical protein
LSHATEENLSRDWANTVSLYGKGTKCAGRGNDEAPACHRMNFGWDHCTKNEESGTAQCQVDISLEEVGFHVKQFIDAKQKTLREA